MTDSSGGRVLPTPSDMLRAYGRPAKKALGQNFLTDPSILDRIVREAQVGPGTPVLEIGPGPGGLTVRLLLAGADLMCIEADRDAAAFLDEQLGHRGLTFRVELGDATGPLLGTCLGFPPRTVVANLPYHVATPILFALVHAQHPPERMVLMFQREVADRIAGSLERIDGLPSVGVGIRYEVHIAQVLPPGAFIPPPKVYSAVVSFRKRSQPLCEGTVEAATLRLAQRAFGQRRKMLRRSLAGLEIDVETLTTAAEVRPDARPEELSLAALIRLGQAWVDAGGAPWALPHGAQWSAP